ncbi:antibiotic biosynthesis monooxygenase [Bradyrhizobium ontarionense]|uniref:Antibiotic biosynthesis monooxygenase n=1 Tax=Bradyrhizobium ontarionense TaxID=2898149 RepID=A0ABY3RCE4_9BRAD|nr:putative quinol monooxygenase [Bradyrhizobium sp. A19]UFZ05064.1 antibiotic biosynthesis monooxygenase [Bradyrhizobium sp. A19]
MTTQLTLIARLTAKPEHSETLGESLRAMIAPTTREEGCLGYIVHRDNNDPNIWIVYETWVSHAALEFHFAQPYTASLLARASDILAKEAEMTYATAMNPRS